MKICRVCLTESDLCNIFGTNENVAFNIMLFASVQVTEGDTLPQYICKLCKVELDICLSFKNKCESSYQALNNQIYTKVETEIIDTQAISESDISVGNVVEEVILVDCPQCDLQFTSLNSYNRHKEKYQHMCNICDLHFEHKKKVSQHLKIDHDIIVVPEKLKQCELCGKKFQYNVELSRHMTVHSNLKKFRCIQCGKNFTSRGGLNKHTVRHNGTRQLACSMCNKKFIHQSNLSEHIKVHSDDKKYKCHICLKSFKARRTLIFHIKIHNNELDFPCNECDKAFTNKFALLRHIKLHRVKIKSENGIEDVSVIEKKVESHMRQCELCGKFCRSLSDLQKHIRVHTGECPFACPYCEKLFKNTSSLNCHIRIHTQDKPHVCKYCGKGFIQSSNLRTHETIHSPIKPHNCDKCERSFNRKRDLVRHLQKCVNNKTGCNNDEIKL